MKVNPTTISSICVDPRLRYPFLYILKPEKPVESLRVSLSDRHISLT